MFFFNFATSNVHNRLSEYTLQQKKCLIYSKSEKIKKNCTALQK